MGLQSPYNKSIAFVISKWVNGTGGSWNTGIVSDAYAQAGLLDMFIVAIVTGLLFYLLDSVTSNQNSQWAVMAVILYAIYMNDNGILTTILTNGLMFMTILLCLYESKDMKRQHNLMFFECKKM